MEPPPANCPSVIGSDSSKVCDGCPNKNICSTSQTIKSASDEMKIVLPIIKSNLQNIKHIILVISGKGGTGKSTVSSNLARALAIDGETQVGILDLDICGPSIPRMFDLEGHMVHESPAGWDPVLASENLAVMSCGFLVESLDDSIIWRGPKKNSLIKEFLSKINWGNLDYLIIDTPPGTSDEHISVVSYLKKAELTNLEGAIMVSTPQEVSLMDVRKQIDFCQRTNLKILGIIENMAKFTCPNCKNNSQIFRPSSGGVPKMAHDFKLKILGSLPLNPMIGKLCDFGGSIFESAEQSKTRSNISGDVDPSAEISCYRDEHVEKVVDELIKIKNLMIQQFDKE